MSTFARLVLFVSCYAPLLALFAILDSFGPGWPSILCAGVSVASVALLVIVWQVTARGAADWLSIRENRSRDAQVMAYFVSYVIPFAAAGAADVRTKTALGVFAVIVAGLYLRASIFYIHPLLLLAGLHVYDVLAEDGSPLIVITRRRFLPQRERLRVVGIGQSVCREARHA